MVAIRRRPWRARWPTALVAPPRLSASTQLAGAVPIDRGTRPGRPADQDGGDAGPLQGAGERVVAVQGGEQHAVDVAAGHVPLQPPPVGQVLGDQQHELDPGPGQGGADPADHAGEERLGEEAGVRLGHDQGDRVGPPGDQAPGGPVGHVAELGHGPLDLGSHGRADLGRPVDDPRDGRPGDPGQGRHLLEGRWDSSPRGPGLEAPGPPAHPVPSPLGPGGRPSRPPRAIASRYQRALSLGSRRWVGKST